MYRPLKKEIFIQFVKDYDERIDAGCLIVPAPPLQLRGRSETQTIPEVERPAFVLRRVSNFT